MSTDGYTHKKGIIYKNQFHVIFCSKYRYPVLKDGIDVRLKEILYKIADDNDVKIEAIEVMPDHVHMFIEFDPRSVLHKIIKIFKRVSAHELRQEFPKLKSVLPCMWTRSYLASTDNHISEDTVKNYIFSQKTRKEVEHEQKQRRSERNVRT